MSNQCHTRTADVCRQSIAYCWICTTQHNLIKNNTSQQNTIESSEINRKRISRNHRSVPQKQSFMQYATHQLNFIQYVEFSSSPQQATSAQYQAQMQQNFRTETETQQIPCQSATTLKHNQTSIDSDTLKQNQTSIDSDHRFNHTMIANRMNPLL